MGKKLSKEQIEAILSKDGYVMIGPYVNSVTKALIRCPKGHETMFLLGNYISRGTRCKICNLTHMSNMFKTDFDEIVKIANEKGITLLTTKEEHAKVHHKKMKIKFKCKCGKKLSKNIGNFKTWKECKKCASTIGFVSRRRIEKLKAIKIFIENKGYKLISKEYFGVTGPLFLECSKHGEWKTRWGDIKNNHWCKKCSNGISGPQTQMIEFIKTFYSGPIIEEDRTILTGKDGLELDVWLPELKIGIEHDGLYWHSEEFKKNAAKANIMKKNAAIKAGIVFLAFFGDEWQKKKNIVKSIIKNKIGAIDNKIYARKTDFIEITNKEAKEFLEANHLEGYAKCSKAFGLKYQDKLVMCVTFRKTFRGEHELARMATLIDHVVVGGASKLLNKAPKPLVTYSNNRLSNGNVYIKLGFKEITETFQPSYFYTDAKIRIFRSNCMKIKDLPGNEREQAKNGAFAKHFGHSKPVYRIYDYGHRKWIKSN